MKYPDLVFTPGAAVMTRVISCPLKGHFTLDLGYKGCLLYTSKCFLISSICFAASPEFMATSNIRTPPRYTASA